jgi:hypothetical protein
MKLGNKQFLKMLFGRDYQRVHVTDFIYDPNDIPLDENLRSWKGDYFKNYQFKKESCLVPMKTI